MLRNQWLFSCICIVYGTLLLIYILCGILPNFREYEYVRVDIVYENRFTESSFSFYSTGNRSFSETEKKTRIKNYYEGIFEREEDERIREEWCKSSEFDPFAKEALNKWDLKNTEKCTVKRYGRIENGHLLIRNDRRLIKAARITYIFRGRKRLANGKLDIPKTTYGLRMHRHYKYTDVNNDDFHVHFSEPVDLDYDSESRRFVSEKLIYDFLKLEILMQKGQQTEILSEYHAHIHDPVKVCRRQDDSGGRHRIKPHNFQSRSSKKNSFAKSGVLSRWKDLFKSTFHRSSGLKYNVAMVMLDAQSRHNVYRQMPRLMQLLHSRENDDVMLFRKHGIHCNLSPEKELKNKMRYFWHF